MEKNDKKNVIDTDKCDFCMTNKCNICDYTLTRCTQCHNHDKFSPYPYCKMCGRKLK
jgi:hypothetical protein